MGITVVDWLLYSGGGLIGLNLEQRLSELHVKRHIVMRSVRRRRRGRSHDLMLLLLLHLLQDRELQEYSQFSISGGTVGGLR